MMKCGMSCKCRKAFFSLSFSKMRQSVDRSWQKMLSWKFYIEEIHLGKYWIQHFSRNSQLENSYLWRVIKTMSVLIIKIFPMTYTYWFLNFKRSAVFKGITNGLGFGNLFPLLFLFAFAVQFYARCINSWNWIRTKNS